MPAPVFVKGYRTNVFWSVEDDCWIADAPTLKSCSAHGETPEEAIAELGDAATGWLEVAQTLGFPIPHPDA